MNEPTIPIPPKNHLILVGRIDAASFQQAKTCYNFLKEHKGFSIQMLELMPMDWQIFKQALQKKLVSLGLEEKFKGVVSEVVYDSDFSIVGPGRVLLDLGKGLGFSDRTLIRMYQSAAKSRLKKHYRLLSERDGVKFVSVKLATRSKDTQSGFDKEIGSILLMLYARECPQTVNHFLTLIEKQIYNNCAINHITDSFIQCDSVAVEKQLVPDECFAHKHDKIGALGMCRNLGERHSNGNTNQFYITLHAMHEFDSGVSKKQCFGRVCDGMRYLKILSRAKDPSDTNGTHYGIMSMEEVNF